MSILVNVQAQKLYTGYSQFDYREKFGDDFDRGIRHLGKGETQKALGVFLKLIEQDSNYHYLHYLTGVCYTETKPITPKSIYHLEKATWDIRTDYDLFSYKEQRAPVFAYFYLEKAYIQHGQCEKAFKARDNFIKLYGEEKDDYFIEKARNMTAKCKEPGRKYQRVRGEVITKHMDYSTDNPLFGVQVGAFSELIPIREFYDLKNVEAFMDKEGVIRYVIGHFLFRNQAESLLKIVRESGYEDAFIVNVNTKQKYDEEVVIVDNKSFKKPIMGKVEYRVQLGAFRDSIPEEIAQIYLKIEGIKESHQDDLSIMTTGSFKSYDEALEGKNKIQKIGINDAFVVAYNYEERISLDQAHYYFRNKNSEDSSKKKK